MKEDIQEYCLRLADTSLILGQRLSEWCGHGPALEEDIALTNLALDHIGQCRFLYQYVAAEEGKGRTEDDFAFLRDVWDFKNLLLVEQPNGDFAQTIARQFYLDTFNYYFLLALQKSEHQLLREYADKAIKEVTYHVRHSSEWVKRLGDGTAESHERMQHGIDFLWSYTGEMFMADDLDTRMLKAGVGVDLAQVNTQWQQKIKAVLKEATLRLPDGEAYMQSGGRYGRHSEHLGFILSDMQWLQRAYPGCEW